MARSAHGKKADVARRNRNQSESIRSRIFSELWNRQLAVSKYLTPGQSEIGHGYPGCSGPCVCNF